MKRAAASLLLVLAVLVVPAGAPARAEGGAAGKGAKGGEFPQVADATAEDAKAILEALKKALGGNDEDKVVAALEPLVTKKSADFVPELKKLLPDKRDKVAAAAARALGSQGDKTAATLLMAIVSADTREKKELTDPLLKAASVEALGRLGVSGAFEPIHKLAKAMTNEPEVRFPYAKTVALACTRYFGLTKEKRIVSWLIDEVDRPNLKGPPLATSPPAEYWKARQDIWEVVRYDAVWALKEITGKEFETGVRWQKWFDTEGKKAGMK